MKKRIPEDIHISPCGSFCLKECQFLNDEKDKMYYCKRFNVELWDDPYGSRPIRCEECCKIVSGSCWHTDGP